MKKNFSNNELMVAVAAAAEKQTVDESSLFTKIRRCAGRAGRKVLRLVLLLWYTFTAETTPFEHKVLIISALAYFILPLDLIPDSIPVVGFSDDLAALAAVERAVSSNITPEIRRRAENKLNSIFGTSSN